MEVWKQTSFKSNFTKTASQTLIFCVLRLSSIDREYKFLIDLEISKSPIFDEYIRSDFRDSEITLAVTHVDFRATLIVIMVS